MSKLTTEETKRYQDPLGAQIQATALARAQRLAAFPPVATVYDGFYVPFEPVSKTASTFLAGGEGAIGTKLLIADKSELLAPHSPPITPPLIQSAENDKATDNNIPTLTLTTQDGRVVTQLGGEAAARIWQRLDDGWDVTVMLSLVIYEESNNRFTGEMACMCYDPVLGLPFEQFVKNITYRLTKGTHPGLALTQEEFMRVIESKGAWYLTKDVPLPERPKGSIVFKRRKVWSEYLVEAAVKGSIGCKIVGILFWAALAAAVLIALWWFLLR
jgi:hypothetical protein